MPGITTHGRRSMAVAASLGTGGRGVHGDDPARGVDLDDGIGLVARAAGSERRQESGAEGERRLDRQVHRGSLAGTFPALRTCGAGQGTTRIGRDPGRCRCSEGVGQRFLPRTSTR